MKLNSNSKKTILGLMIATLLIGCGGGSTDDAESQDTTTLSGVFVDAKVKGLRYKTETLEGYTDTNGIFKYKNGENIEFFLGNLSFGLAKAKSLMTPYTMAGDTDLQNPSAKALNIALLLQNCDANRTNKDMLDVEKLKSYSFASLDLNQTSVQMESKINTLLSTGVFQGLIDSNNTLIDTVAAKEHLTGNVEKVECSIVTIVDDSSFSDTFPSDIEWSGNSSTVEDIARVFNYARGKDSTITQELVMPSQAVWDAMSIQERGLYLLNNERYYRGIKPYEGISNNVATISQSYANVLYTTGTFGHNEDGSPWDRLDRDTLIKNNKDFFSYGENLYAYGSSAAYVQNPIARAIYGFIYDDDAATAGSYGHRKFCFATGLNDNSAENGEEGLVGFAITQGTEYSFYPGYYSTIVVMNAFDPSDTWNHSTTIKVPFCSIKKESTAATPSGRFTVDNAEATVVDTTTSLMWQNSSLGFGEAAAGISRCETSTFAGFSDWRLPSKVQAGEFQFQATESNVTLQHVNTHCTAEVATDGYIRTELGAQSYGGLTGSSINFRGGANIRCVRSN